MSIGIDLLFLAAVVVLNWVAEQQIFDRFDLHGSAGVAFVILEWAFTISTVGTVLGYLLRDLVVAVARPWRARGSVTDG